VELGGRRILVTGGGAGIGAAIVEACAAAGAAVAVNDLDEKRAAASARAAGGYAIPGDVAGDEAGQIVDEAATALGGLDGLVNNAGIVMANTLDNVSAENWDRVMRVNMRSVFLMSRAFAQIAHDPSAVVNLASIAASHPNPGTQAYTPSKAAVVGFTKQAAVEWGPKGIRFNAVAPGMISETNMSAAESEELRRRRGAVLPLRRTGVPADVADVVVFLLSDAARYVTGQVIGVDGGWDVSLLTFTPRPWET
jgi:NAD(P)-dependent dehydrogenase (short-subunit alcohol dehydrogenase family)